MLATGTNQKTTQPDFIEPHYDCGLCPRLRDFILQQRQAKPEGHNGPVRAFMPKAGLNTTRLLIIGLAPGLRGANYTGRPFTGDYAGELLYSSLKKYGFAEGTYSPDGKDSLQLINTCILNAVRCVPPQNKPTGAEINQCRQFFVPFLYNLPELRAILVLGRISHESTVRALNQPLRLYPFRHGERYSIGKIELFQSYHCSRYNTNTGRLTTNMFETVLENIQTSLRS